MTGGDQEKPRRQAAQKAVKSMMQTNENDAQIEALLEADEHRQAHEKRSGNGLERNDLDTGEWRNGNNFSDLLDIDSEEEAEEEVDNEIDCLVARLQQLRATKKAARTRKSPKSTETFLAPNSVDLNDLRAPTFQQLGALNPNVLCWPQNQQVSGYATPSVPCLGNQSLHTACSHTVVNGFPPVPEVSAFQPNPTCGMPPIKANMGHFNSPHTWQGAQCLPQHQPAHAYPQHPLQMLSQQPQAPFSPLHQPYVTYTPQHNPMNSSNTEMGQVMGQLANVVSWQAAQTRREELKSIPKLDGFEGHAKVTEFFRQFEDATEGCSDREREKLLRKKCLNRAKHLLEDVLETVNNNYELVKATLLMEISGASTEREEALQKLSAGLFRGYRESLNSYSGRITETVKAAFPGMTKEGRESLSCHYFTRGLKDVQLVTAMAALHGLTYHQQVAQAVQIEAKLNTVRGATPKTENQWKLSSETPRDQPGNNGNRFHQNGSLPPIRRENGANTQFVRDRMTQGANKQPTNRFTGANNHNVHNRALNITRNEPKKPYRNGQKGPLVGVFKKGTCSNKRINRLLAEMIPHFQLEIKYIEGKRNVMADALSRAFEPSRAEKSENLDKAVTETVDAVTYAPTARVAAIEITPEKWRNELRTEPKFGDIFRYLQNEILPEEEDVRKTVLAEAPSFCVLDDDLFHVANDGKTTKVVPSQFRNDLLQDTHAGPLGAHMSACKLFELIRKKYFWPNLRADCEKVCRLCDVCALNRTSLRTKPPLESIKTTVALELLCVDVLKIGMSRSGNQYVVVMIDHFSKFLVAVPTPDKSAATVARAIGVEWILKFGPPSRLHSDKGTEFCNAINNFLCESFGILRGTTSAYHPQGNGVTERANRDIIAMLRKSPTSRFDWDERLPFIVYAHNCLSHRSTKCAPFELIFGRSPKWPTLMSEGKTPSFKYTIDIDTYLELLKENLSTLSQIALENADCMRAENKANYDIRNKTVRRNFEPGENVFVRRPHDKILRARCEKIAPINEGPFRIISTEPTSAKIDKGDGEVERVRVTYDMDYSDDDYWTEEWRRRREDPEKRETAAAEEDEEPKNIPDKEMAQQSIRSAPDFSKSTSGEEISKDEATKPNYQSLANVSIVESKPPERRTLCESNLPRPFEQMQKSRSAKHAAKNHRSQKRTGFKRSQRPVSPSLHGTRKAPHHFKRKASPSQHGKATRKPLLTQPLSLPQRSIAVGRTVAGTQPLTVTLRNEPTCSSRDQLLLNAPTWFPQMVVILGDSFARDVGRRSAGKIIPAHSIEEIVAWRPTDNVNTSVTVCISHATVCRLGSDKVFHALRTMMRQGGSTYVRGVNAVLLSCTPTSSQ